MNKQHKWHKEIKAWADGAEIECKHKTFNGANWEDVKDPMWLDDVEYRIKPQPKSDTSISVLERDYNFMRDLAIGTEELLNKTTKELNEVKEMLAQRNLELLEAQDKLIKKELSIPQPNGQQCCCQKVTPSPQYLYAYLSPKSAIEFCTFSGTVRGYDYLGKIKLEADD